MACRSLLHGCFVVLLSLVVVSADSPRAGATQTVLASASFENDTLGAVARPNGPLTVVEDVWDSSTYAGGSSEVVAAGSTKRYRISDVGSVGEAKGVSLPFSSEVSAGTLTIEAVVTAEQTGSDGGYLCVSNPEDHDWPSCIGFGSDGKFRVHGAPTTTSYTANFRYRFQVVIHFGESPTVDYLVTEFVSGQTVLESEGNALPTSDTAAAIVFRTDVDDIGAFTVDALSAVQ